MDAGGGAAALVGDVHAGGGDIDSLLSTDPEVGDKGRRLGEPYERHRAHDLRAECYRRGIRPIKKGPHANDNKGGYILLLRRYDGAPGGLRGVDGLDDAKRHEDGDQDGTGDDGDDDDGSGGSSASMGMSPHDPGTGASKKRKLLPPHLSAASLGMGQSLVGLGGGGASDLAAASAASNGDLQGFYEAAQAPGLVPVLPMQYSTSGMAPGKPVSASGNSAAANSATDLEILSGIANTYTQNAANDGQLCGNCRTVVTDQLMESIRLGRSRMQLEEWYRLAEQRDRDTHHLKDVLAVMGDLRKAFREAQADGINHDLLVELEDDLAFFQELKERTKERMRRAAQDAQARAAAKANVTA
jgi:hypothetical protein